MTEREASREKLDLGKRIVLFIGPEGSGKTIAANRLAEESDKPYIATGGILRDLQENDKGELGDTIRKMFAENTYLNGDTLLEILVDRFAKDDTVDGFILDGGLRTLGETIDFQAMLETAGRSLPLTIVYLKISEETSFERLVSGKNARRREDDTYRGVTSRLAKFFFQLEDRIEVIKKNPNWELVEIDAEATTQEVYEFLVTSLKS